MENIVFTVSFKSKGGLSVYRDLEKLNRITFKDFAPEAGAVERTREEFASRGFFIEAASEVGLSVSCSQKLFEDTFKVKVRKEKIKYIRDFEKFVYVCDDPIEPPFCKNFIERISLPKQSFELESLMETERPSLGYYHLDVPHDVRRVARVEALHSSGITGEGINVAGVDTGLYNHRYFRENKLSFEAIPAVSSFDGERDERGHGTAMSSVLLSVAPRVSYKMVKLSDYYFSYPVAAFQKASMLRPDIINCSWGIIGYEPHIYLEIANAVDKGCIVVYSSGNGSSDRRASLFQTICYPDVISVGGCFPNEDGSMEASDIASSYESDIFRHRFAPDVCGTCGKLPKAQLILLPTQPGGIFDRNNGKRDGTRVDDGWLVSSGTSAAAAYVSGMLALILQKYPSIKREHMKNILQNSCVDVLAGASFMGNRADMRGWNKATGFGFLQAEGIEKLFSSRDPLIIRGSLGDKTQNTGLLGKNYCCPDIIVKNEAVEQPQVSLGVNYKHRDDFSDFPGDGGSYAYIRVQNNTLENRRHRLKIFSAPISPVINPAFWREEATLDTGELEPGSFNVCGPVFIKGGERGGHAVFAAPEGIHDLGAFREKLVKGCGVFQTDSYKIPRHVGSECSFYINNPLGREYSSTVLIELQNLDRESITLEYGGKWIDLKEPAQAESRPQGQVSFEAAGNVIAIRDITGDGARLDKVRIRLANTGDCNGAPSYIHVFQKINETDCGYLRFIFSDQ